MLTSGLGLLTGYSGGIFLGFRSGDRLSDIV